MRKVECILARVARADMRYNGGPIGWGCLMGDGLPNCQDAKYCAWCHLRSLRVSRIFKGSTLAPPIYSFESSIA